MYYADMKKICCVKKLSRNSMPLIPRYLETEIATENYRVFVFKLPRKCLGFKKYTPFITCSLFAIDDIPPLLCICTNTLNDPGRLN